MKWTSKTLMFAAAVWMLQGSMPGSAEAQAKPYYEGKTILVIVGSGPGAGNDIRTRLFARHAARHIPGKPQLVVQNRSGGGGLRARNYLYNIAKPDGLTIAEIIRGTGLQDAIDEPAARFRAPGRQVQLDRKPDHRDRDLCGPHRPGRSEPRRRHQAFQDDPVARG